MKKVLILAFLLSLLFPITSQAQQSSIIRLCTDAYCAYNAICEFPDGYVAKAEIYIWIYHPTLGIDISIFALDYPGNVQPEDTFYVNDNLLLAYWGDLNNGIEVATECITGWNWLLRQTIWITSSDVVLINVVPHSDPIYNNNVIYFSCTGGEYQFEYIFPLEINVNPDTEPCLEPLDLVVGVESCSWGAIKSQYISK